MFLVASEVSVYMYALWTVTSEMGMNGFLWLNNVVVKLKIFA